MDITDQQKSPSIRWRMSSATWAHYETMFPVCRKRYLPMSVRPAAKPFAMPTSSSKTPFASVRW